MWAASEPLATSQPFLRSPGLRGGGDRQRQDRRGHGHQATHTREKQSHTRRLYRMKNWPEG